MRFLRLSVCPVYVPAPHGVFLPVLVSLNMYRSCVSRLVSFYWFKDIYRYRVLPPVFSEALLVFFEMRSL